MARIVWQPDLAVRVQVPSRELLVKVADEIVKDAKRFVPIESGYLRSRIHAERPSGNSIRIVADADYAAFVELGTRYMKAQPYLRPAAFKKRGS